VTPRCDRQKAVSRDPLHRRWKASAVCAPLRAHGSARPGTESVSLAHPSPYEGCAAMSPVVGCSPGCGWSSPPRSSHVSRPLPPSPRPCAGRMSVVAPSPQSGITRVMRERVVSRPPLIAWVARGDGCRVPRGRRACLRLVACARDGRGAGHGAAAAAPERIGGARDGLEQPVHTWSGRLAATTGAALGAVRITLPGGRTASTPAAIACPPAAPHAAPRPSAPGRSRQRRCRRISRGRWPTSLVAGDRLGELGPLGAQGLQVVSGPTVSR